jgi:hypothetical protein
MSYVQRRRFLWILFLAGLALLVGVANATTLARMQFEELVQQATAVARVRCLGAESRWENGEQNKGSLPGFVSVKMLGGRVGNLHSRIEDVPSFRAGEEAYVFLWTRNGEPYRVLGWTQGTFRIARDARTGLETVTQDSAASPMFDLRTRQFRHGGIRNLPIAIFQLKLRKALERNAP